MYSAGKLLMDPLHGGIPLNNLEVRVIDHPLMQRLRFISQNDVLQFAFPGATHNRFAHSIGAMHVAGCLFDSAIRNALTGFRKLPASISPEEASAIGYLRQAVRLAVLLHDTGHGPFSHQSERCESLHSLLSTPGRFHRLWRGIPKAKEWYPEPPGEMHHEHYSVRMSYEIMTETDALPKDLCYDVIALLDSTEKEPSAQFIKHAQALPEPLIGMVGSSDKDVRHFMRVLSNLVSGILDADRLDYLMRDTLYTGAKYGQFNLDMICNCLTFHRDGDWFGMAIREQGAGALEDFLHARMRMYRQIYQHKTARGCFGYILHRAIDEVLEDEEFRSKVEDCAKNPKRFFALNDNLFWSQFTEHGMRDPDSMCARLIFRKPLKHMLTKESSEPAEMDKERERIADDLGVPVSEVVCMHDRFSFAPKPGSAKSDALRILKGHPLKKGVSSAQLSHELPLYDAFAKGCEIYTFLYCPKKERTASLVADHVL